MQNLPVVERKAEADPIFGRLDTVGSNEACSDYSAPSGVEHQVDSNVFTQVEVRKKD